MGTPDFAVPSLETLIQNGYPVAAVVTAPDKPRGRGQELSPTPVKNIALLHGIPLFQPASLTDPAFVESLRTLNPDLIVVVAFRILPKEVFTIPRLGSFNLHASLLPRYRGAAPINWAIINGETRTGVTTFFLEEKVDTGNMLLQSEIPISPEEDAGSLHDRLAALGAKAVLDTVKLIESGTANPTRQDNAAATPAPKIFKEDCHIRWNTPAAYIRNFIRGLSPHPAAYSMLSGKVLKIYRARLIGGRASGQPGELIASASSLHVSTADGLLALDDLQLEGRKRMTVEEFLRGYHPKTGDRLE
jgi:methionyl-tRNA formyltransferase